MTVHAQSQGQLRAAALALIACCACGVAAGFTTEPQIMVWRTMDATTVRPGDTFPVTISVAVSAIGSDPARGLFVSDHVPVGLSALAGTVTVGGVPTSVLRETDPAGTTHPGATTERWVLETPTLWTENVPVDASTVVVVSYDLVVDASAQAGDLVFPGFNWVAMIAAQLDAGDHFGYEDTPPTVTIIDDRAPQIASVAAVGVDTVVTVQFDEIVDEGSATTASNYAIDNGVVVGSAVMEDPSTVSLIVSTLTAGPTYTLTVNGVTDTSANAIATDSQGTFTFVEALVVEWALDTGSGATAVDSSPNSNDGTITGATWTARGAGSALTFNGTSDFVQRTITSWDASEYTVAIRARASTGGQDLYVSVFNNAGTAANDSMQLDFDGGNPGRWRAYFSSVNVAIGTVTPGVWQHLAFSYDGTTVRTYLDGVLQSSAAVAHANAGTLFRQYAIGRNRGANKYFAGDLDDMCVYNRALAGAAISELASP